MKFTRYNSIENSYRQKFLDKIAEEGHSKEIFVVQEKIHGANFSIFMTDDEFKPGKRSGFIKENEKFFNYGDIIDKYIENFRLMFDSLKSTRAANQVSIHGELYGGNYPHEDVPKTDQSAVQKGVYYSPEQDFIAFDVKVDGSFLDVLEVNELFNKFNIPFCETLFKGSLEECLEYSNEFQTTIPQINGLPEIEGNMCEGVVIRSINPLFLWDRSRLILKNKNEKFKEVTAARAAKEITPLSPEATAALDKVGCYITENRLRNVISKVGEITQKDFGKVMGLFTQDIIEDFLKDEQEFFDTLEKSDRKIVTKKVGQSAAFMLRSNFMNVVDGEF